jgi:hypothetical protein
MVELRSGRRRRPPGSVQSVQPVIVRRVVDRFHVAADAGAFRLREPQHRRRRDRRVGGVAALLEDLQAGLGGQRLAGRDDAVAGEHLGASLFGPEPLPVAAHRSDVGRWIGDRPGRDAEWRRRDTTGRRERGGGNAHRHHCDHDGPRASPPRHLSAHTHGVPFPRSRRLPSRTTSALNHSALGRPEQDHRRASGHRHWVRLIRRAACRLISPRASLVAAKTSDRTPTGTTQPGLCTTAAERTGPSGQASQRPNPAPVW